MGLTCDLYQVGPGIGDACWHSALVGARPAAGPRVVFVDQTKPGGVDAYLAISLWDWVFIRPWNEPLPPPARDMATWDVPPGPVRFDPAWLKARPALPPGPYTAVQPASGWYKDHRIAPRPTAHPAVLVGSAEDARAPWPGAAVDLRGRLSVAESLWVVANAADCLGCESWPALLAALCGRPARMVAWNASQQSVLEATVARHLPSLTVLPPE